MATSVQGIESATAHIRPIRQTKSGCRFSIISTCSRSLLSLYRAAVARVVLSRFPAAAEPTVARCAVVLARLLPVDDADAIVDLVRASSEEE